MYDFIHTHWYNTIVIAVGKWLKAGAYVLVWSVIGRLMVRVTFVPFALTMLTIHSLFECQQLAPASAADWSNKGRAMCYHIYVIMHVKIPSYPS